VGITQVAAESVAWLAQGLRPVLAARHLAGNLLRMLGLCYLGPGALQDTPEGLPEQRVQ
jgi:WD repeat-containing protein 81